MGIFKVKFQDEKKRDLENKKPPRAYPPTECRILAQSETDAARVALATGRKLLEVEKE